MRDLYDQLLAGGEAAIAQLVSERRQEDVSLEFKTKTNAASGEPNRDDRQNLAIALSAFSNSMGGLILWGVTARKDTDGVDCATELQPIATIERFKADVTRLISQAIMPRHDGVLVEAVPCQKSRGAGYLAIYAERSERRPHRAELGVGRYFKRIGDSSVAMEHYDIEDSFKRLVVPRLEIEWHITPGPSRGGSVGEVHQVKIELGLHNPSLVSGRFPYLTLARVRGASWFSQPAGFEPDLRCRTDRSGQHFFGGADDVLHPGLTATIPPYLLTPEIPVSRREEGRVYVRRGSLQPVAVAYQCGCYNSPPAIGEFSISDDELVERGIVGGYIY